MSTPINTPPPVIPAQEYEARATIWASLTNELRSRLAILEASGELKKISFNEPLLHEFSMSANDGFLSVWLRAETGKRSWNAIGPHLNMAEPWYLSADGEFKIDGVTMKLAEAADRFIAKVSREWTGSEHV